MIYDKVHALRSLKPNKDFVWSGIDYSGLTYYGGDTVPTESEIDAEVTRLNKAEPMRLLREERDNKLAACDWRASSDLTITDDWKNYRQALRDLPASASPKVDASGNLDMSSVTFPTEPT
jgi:hypothetical protein|tara:strand:- start:2237 stop:2596 length:360 start_codon:yes stop_codon:yes gene_type:complete